MYIVTTNESSKEKLEATSSLVRWTARILSGGSEQEFVFYADDLEEAERKVQLIFPSLQFKITKG